MSDTKQTKSIGEHHVASELARRGWSPALTRDGLERTDILAVQSTDSARRLVEVQVKSAIGPQMKRISWPLGTKAQGPSRHGAEFFVMVAIPSDCALPPRDFVVPRVHVAAAAWISHMDWLTEPGIEPGQRNASIDRSRVALSTFESYENRWDLLEHSQFEAPVLLPHKFRELAADPRVGLPDGHEWLAALPAWAAL